jgi:photosystem II stability/assembly factor-like uncharacterized protein
MWTEAPVLLVAGLAMMGASAWGCEGCKRQRNGALDEEQASVAVDGSPSDAMAQRGRIYASTDGGRSWRVSDNGLPGDATVNDFAVASGVVFVGTSGDGVYASRDLGASWELVMPAVGGDEAVNAMVTTSSVVMAGMRARGVVASSDGGKSWRAANEGLSNLEVRRLAEIEGRVFAGTNGGLFVSGNHGESWDHLVGVGQINGVAGLHGDLYVADVDGVLVSRDAGRSWQRTYDDSTPHNLGSDGNSLFAMLYWQGVVRTSDGQVWEAAQKGLPKDLTQYTFQIVHVDGKLFAAQWHGVYVSDSGGTTWRLSNEGLASDLAITDIVSVAPNVLLAAAVVSSSAR